MAEASGPVSPAVQLRERLEECRVEGLLFEDAWAWATKRVKWPHDTTHRREWKRILGLADEEDMTLGDRLAAARQVKVWRACYERHPVSRREEPLQRLELVA